MSGSLGFGGETSPPPIDPKATPSEEFIEWHTAEVFLGPEWPA